MSKINLIAFALMVCFPLILNGAGARAALVDGAPSITAAKNAGFYAWRDAKGVWHIRLTSGKTWQYANGRITTTRRFGSMTRVATESNDRITRPSPTEIDFKLHVARADLVDGIDFATPGGAGLCLWLWSSAGNAVLLGAGATPVRLAGNAVDLLQNGGCGQSTDTQPADTPSATSGDTPPPDSQSTDAQPAGVGSLKYHPGHYIAMRDADTEDDMIAVLQPGVAGIHRRYFWKDLEPAPDNYDFSRIASDLQLAADHGAQLIAMIVDKSYDGAMPTPPYLWDVYTLPHVNYWTQQPAGWVAKRWDPYVVSRLAALFQALGARFDGDPHFEGIALQESILGLSSDTMTAAGYTPEAYRDALIQILNSARAALPTSEVFWSMNFLDGNNSYIGQIADAVAPIEIAMGVSDILPDHTALQTYTYPYCAQYRDQMTLFGSIQYNSYRALHVDTSYPTKYWTMPELFAFARDNLYVSYLFWTHVAKPNPQDSYTWLDALGVIAGNPAPFR
jgi:hypothetical protein